jgi:hypothetical protein
MSGASSELKSLVQLDDDQLRRIKEIVLTDGDGNVLMVTKITPDVIEGLRRALSGRRQSGEKR